MRSPAATRARPLPVGEMSTARLAIASLLALALLLAAASLVLQPLLRATPAEILNGLTSPAALDQRTT
jgi:4-hydroxybenzoate polyprenyltransferase